LLSTVVGGIEVSIVSKGSHLFKLSRRDLLRSGVALSATSLLSSSTTGQAQAGVAGNPEPSSEGDPVLSGTDGERRPKPVSYLLGMVHHNPGEPLFLTKYVRADYLKSLGWNGDAARIFIQAAVGYERFDADLISQDSATWAWIQRYAHNLDHLIEEHKQAGIPLYPFTDVLVVPHELAVKYGKDMKDAQGRFSIQRPQTQAVMRAQIEAIFRRFPDVEGLTTRFGETYLSDTPFHVGESPVHSMEDHTLLIGILRDEICVKRNKKLLYRTWDFGGLHTHPERYLQVTNPVEPHPNLIFSIKHTNADYLRDVPFNQTLGIGKHRQIVEVSMMQAGCYGKGAYPYYIGRGVLHGWDEMSPSQGIDRLVRNGKICGIYMWPRGDGWGGPYISNEFWVDLNAYVIGEFGKRPWMNDRDLCAEYCSKKLHLNKTDAEKLYELCLLSTHATFIGAQSEIFHIAPWWQRDDNLTSVDLRNVDRQKVLAEKAKAVFEWKKIESLAREIPLENMRDREFLQVSSTYGRIYFSIVEQLWTLQVLEYEDRDETNKRQMRVALQRYEALWKEWRQLERDHACCPTLYNTAWPQTFPPMWREHPSENGMRPNHDTPLVTRCKAAAALS
jgi:hypothetical protein